MTTVPNPIETPPPTHLRGLGFAGQPQGLRTLFFAEMWERFSYYGMRALLTLFMVAPIANGGLDFSTAEAARIYGNYTMAVYMLSIPGGYLADNLLGAKRAVLWGGIIIAAGHLTLAIPAELSFYAGLILVALGTGLLKPSISALVGALYGKNDDRRDAGFSLFYMGINIGAFVAPLATGFLAQSAAFKSFLQSMGFDPSHSWHWGFGAAAVGMGLGLAVFVLRSHRLPDSERPPELPRNFWRNSAAVIAGTVVLMALLILSDAKGYQWLRIVLIGLPVGAALWFGFHKDVDLKRIGAIFVLFIAAMLFWGIFEQMGLSIALFADQLTDNTAFGVTIPSAWYQSLNALFVIALAPLFAFAWMRLGPRQPSSPVKFAIGLMFLGASFLLMVPAAALTAAGKVSPLWLVGLFFLQTVGELFLSPVGLSTMTKLAPARLTGLVLGIWFLAAAFGNKIAGILGRGFDGTDSAALSQFFLHQAILVFAASLALLALSPWVRRLMGSIR
jgi:proton-dependent oligopeptide transporter, POT family